MHARETSGARFGYASATLRERGLLAAPTRLIASPTTGIHARQTIHLPLFQVKNRCMQCRNREKHRMRRAKWRKFGVPEPRSSLEIRVSRLPEALSHARHTITSRYAGLRHARNTCLGRASSIHNLRHAPKTIKVASAFCLFAAGVSNRMGNRAFSLLDYHARTTTATFHGGCPLFTHARQTRNTAFFASKSSVALARNTCFNGTTTRVHA